MEIFFDFKLMLAGSIVGFAIGLTGVGAGAIMTPILILLFGTPPLIAIGTNLWFGGLTRIYASTFHHKNKTIDWKIAKYLWLGSLPSSAIAIVLMKFHLVNLDAENLKIGIGLILLITAITIFFQEKFKLLGISFGLKHQQKIKAIQAFLTVICGFILGFLVTFTSIGAGALGTVMLCYLYPIKLTPTKLIATNIIHAIPLAIFAGLGHLFLGNVDFFLVAWILVGSLPGIYFGIKLVYRINAYYLRLCLASAIALAALPLI